MFRKITSVTALCIAFGGAAAAETFDIQMLNRGEEGTMIFEPSSLRVAVGDTVRFLATDRGHNAESIEEMMPQSAEMFEGRINEEIEVTFDVEGLYGIKCKPHFAMGMVMVIAVGDGETVPDDFLEGRMPRRTKERFQAQLDAL